MANYSLLPDSKQTGGQFSEFTQLLQQLEKMKDGTGGQLQSQAAPSASAPGQATPNAGVPSNPTLQNQQAPIPLGAPQSKTGSGSFASSQSTPSPMRSTSGGPPISSYNPIESEGLGDGGSPYMTGSEKEYGVSVNTPTNIGGPAAETGPSMSGDYGEIGGILAAVSDTAFQLYDMFSVDQQEELMRAQENLLQQQFDIRENWKAMYNAYMLPDQVATKNYARQQLGKGSKNSDYVELALKGYIEGGAGVLAGSKEWDTVFADIEGDLEAYGEPPDTWKSSFESHMQNDTVPLITRTIVANILSKMGLGESQAGEFGLVLAKYGMAMINASRDMREMGQTGLPNN